MMRNLFTGLLAALTILCSSSALAIFDAQLFVYGQRSGELKPSSGDAVKIKGHEMQAAFHIDPIPLIPIGFGIYASQQTYEPDTDKLAYTKMTGIEGGVQLYAWFPLSIKSLKPYAKLGYPVFSAIKADSKLTVGTEEYEYSSVLETSGPHINFGVSYKPLPLVPVAILLEVDMGQQKVKEKDIKTSTNWPAGTADPTAVEYDYNSTAILLGVEAGL